MLRKMQIFHLKKLNPHENKVKFSDRKFVNFTLEKFIIKNCIKLYRP